MNRKKIDLTFIFLLVLNLSLLSQNAWQVTSESDDGTGSLRLMLAEAQEGDTIYFAAAIDTVRLTNSELSIDKSLFIIGNANITTIARKTDQLQFRIFRIQSEDTIRVEFRNLSIMGGNAPDGISADDNGQPGGGIYIPDSIHHIIFYNCYLTKNKSGNGYRKPTDPVTGNGGHGGGIYSRSRLTFFGCSISENICGEGAIAGSGGNWTAQSAGSGGGGGGIYCLNDLILEDCILENNHAGKGGDANGYIYSLGGDGGRGGGGGAVVQSRGVINVIRTEISFNSAGQGGNASNSQTNCSAGSAGNGGGLNLSWCTAFISDCEVRGNWTRRGGGASGNEYGSGKPGGEGGGIYAINTTTTIDHCTIAENYTGNGGGSGGYSQYVSPTDGGCGGGMSIKNSSFKLEKSDIFSNRTGNGASTSSYFISGGNGGSGGGACFSGSAEGSQVVNCLFQGNLTGNGGKYTHNFQGSPMKKGNGGNGGAIADLDSTVAYINCIFSGNRCGNAIFQSAFPPGGAYTLPRGGSGGAIYFSRPDRVLINCTLAGNSAGSAVVAKAPRESRAAVPDSLRGHGGAIFSENLRVQSINSIFAFNYIADSLLNDLEGPVMLNYSLLSTDTLTSIEPGTGNLVGFDPAFVSFPNDLHLSELSGAINHGTPDTTGLGLPVTDPDGNPRIFGNRVDMGAYEFQGEPGTAFFITANVIYMDSTLLGSFSVDSLIIYNLSPYEITVSDLQAAAPFSLSTDKISWGTSLVYVVIPPGDPANPQPVFVKFEPAGAGMHAGHIFISIADSITDVPIFGFCKSYEGTGESLPIPGLVIAPNPLSHQATISFSLTESSSVRIEVFNSDGLQVDDIHLNALRAGHHSTFWSRGQLPAGVYYFVIRIGNETAIKKVVVYN